MPTERKKEMSILPNYEFGIGLVYIAWMVIWCISKVGEIYPASTYSWGLPFVMLVAVGFPFILGWVAGSKAKQK